MKACLDKAAEIIAAGEVCTLVTVAGVRGSAPREVGAAMLVTRDAVIGTLGGGQLEYQCTRIAWEHQSKGGRAFSRRFPLGANCGQCCGGVVEVLFEELSEDSRWITELVRARSHGDSLLLVTTPDPDGGVVRRIVEGVDNLPIALANQPSISAAAERALGDGYARRIDGNNAYVLLQPVVASHFRIAVFGAGHVGTATVAVLATLDTQIRWIDSRPGLLPGRAPANVQTIENSEPVREVAAMPAGSFFLVLTHSHPLDYEICRAVLAREDVAWLGLIGSRSKRRRFEKRFRADGVNGAERLTCPIGIEGIRGKKPAEIALAVSAQLLQLREATAASASGNQLRQISRHAG